MSERGWRLEIHDELASTSDTVIGRAEAGEVAGLAVMARRQTRARGSRGRSWVEPSAGNLAVSVLLRPGGSMATSEQAVFRAALALIETLDAFAGSATLTLKWPNDVLLDGRKLAGILVESSALGDRLQWLVVGFGANLAAAPTLTLPAGRPAPACLVEGGRTPVTPETVVGRLLPRLDHWMAVAFADVRAAWLARAHPIGAPLVVDGVAGRFAGLSATGALLFEATSSGCRPAASGEAAAAMLEAANPHPT